MDNPQPEQQQPESKPPFGSVPRPYATYALLGILAVVFVAQIMTNTATPTGDIQPLLDFGSLDFRRVLLDHEYYRLFTSMFLHLGPAHFGLNAIALYIFGQIVERNFGRWRYLTIYLLGGLSGSLASFIFTRGDSVGASGAVFAVLGAEMVFLVHNWQWLGQAATRELRSLVILAALNLGVGLLTQVLPGSVGIDNWGHIGGLVGGIILAWFIAPQFQVRQDAHTPTGYRLEEVSLARSWLPPLIFASALALATVYALIYLRA